MNKRILKGIIFIGLISLLFNSCAEYNSKHGTFAERKEKKRLAKEWVKNGAPKDTVYVEGEYVPPVKPSYVPAQTEYRPSETKLTDLIHTKLEVSFNWKKQYLYGEAELVLAPYFYPQNTLVLDAKGFDIDKVALKKGDELIPLTYDYSDSIQLKIELDKLYKKDEKYKVYIKYTSKPNELDLSGASQAISDDKGLYFINPLGKDSTKPRQIWTQGETEASSCWFPTIDQPNEKTTEEIAITVDTAFVTISNGELTAQLFHEDGTRTDYWEQDKPHSPYLFMMAIGEFALIQDTWLAPEAGERLDVNYYVEKEYAQHAMKIFGNTPEMLGFFSKKLGYEYPWDKYSQVIVRDYVSGAMENTSASIFMEAVQITDRELLDKNWDYIIAHELFHHWFGDLVTCESWGQLSLNESFANYSEYLWYEYKYGREYADNHRDEELSGYMRQAKTAQYPIVRYNYAHRMDMFDAHSYNKGGLVLHMLRKQIGDKAFFESLKHYLHKNEYTDAEIHELRLSFEEVTGEDLNWFFNQWFLSPGHPILDVSKKWENDTLTFTVNQLQDSLYTPYYKIHTDLLVKSNSNVVTHKFIIDGKTSEIKIPLSVKPEFVLFDSEQSILGEINYEMTYDEQIALYNYSNKYQVRADAIDALLGEFASTNYILRNDTTLTEESDVPRSFIVDINNKVLGTLIKGLDDSSEFIRKESLLSLKGYNSKKQEILFSKFKRMAKFDKASYVRAQAISNLSSFYPDESEKNKNDLNKLFIEAIQDSSYAVVGDALLACVANNIEGSDQFIAEYQNSSKIGIVKAVAKYFIQKEDSLQTDWIKQVFQKAKPAEKIDLIGSLSSLTKITEKKQRQLLLEFFKEIGIEGEDIYSRYASYRILHALHSVPNADELRAEVIAKEESSFLVNIYAGWESSVR